MRASCRSASVHEPDARGRVGQLAAAGHARGLGQRLRVAQVALPQLAQRRQHVGDVPARRVGPVGEREDDLRAERPRRASASAAAACAPGVPS